MSKNRLIYLLKHNAGIQKAYRVLVGACFRFLSIFIRKDSKLILFSSFAGKNFNDSPKAIYDYMRSHSEYQSYRMVWAFTAPEHFPNLDTVKIDTVAYFVLAMRAKYWITNVNIERGLHFKKKSTVYLNTWHGIALKLIGNDCPGRKDYDFSNMDFLVVSGDHDERVFKSAFRADEHSFLRCGMPRNDILWNPSEDKAMELRQKLHLPLDKKIILYAPTWRESTDGGKTYAIAPPINLKKWEMRLGEEYIVLFRAHLFTTQVMGIQYNDFVRDVSEYPDINELMLVSDILLTDYSSAVFDYAILKRPILTFAYDYESYLMERGTYFNMDEVYPSKACRSEDELLERILTLDYADECKKTAQFRKRFVQYGGHGVEACVKALLGPEESDVQRKTR